MAALCSIELEMANAAFTSTLWLNQDDDGQEQSKAKLWACFGGLQCSGKCVA
jgi:hypothetical protein